MQESERLRVSLAANSGKTGAVASQPKNVLHPSLQQQNPPSPSLQQQNPPSPQLQQQNLTAPSTPQQNPTLALLQQQFTAPLSSEQQPLPQQSMQQSCFVAELSFQKQPPNLQRLHFPQASSSYHFLGRPPPSSNPAEKAAQVVQAEDLDEESGNEDENAVDNIVG